MEKSDCDAQAVWACFVLSLHDYLFVKRTVEGINCHAHVDKMYPIMNGCYLVQFQSRIQPRAAQKRQRAEKPQYEFQTVSHGIPEPELHPKLDAIHIYMKSLIDLPVAEQIAFTGSYWDHGYLVHAANTIRRRKEWQMCNNIANDQLFSSDQW
jgi:hypothetical protein